MTDWIRETLSARAKSLGLTAYGIGVRCDPPLDPGTVNRYLTGRCRLNSEYVGRICDVLGLVVKPGKRKDFSG